MQPILNIAIRAVRKAGAYLLRERETCALVLEPEQLQTLRFETTMLINEVIAKSFPTHGILTEFSEDQTPTQEIIWHVEAISGSENFVRGIPHIAMVIVIEELGVVQHALIFDPYADEIFTASYGRQVQFNRFRVRVKNALALKHDVLLGVVGMQNLELGDATAYYQGCPALTLAYVAAGRLEGFVGKHLSAIDIKAGALMIQEAGGLVTDFSGEDNMVNQSEMVAGAPKLLKALLQSVRK